jgi:hypothetical protein
MHYGSHGYQYGTPHFDGISARFTPVDRVRAVALQPAKWPAREKQ